MRRLILLFIVYGSLTVFSQFILLLVVNFPSAADLIFISNETSMFMRNSLITQSLYLIASFLIFVFVWTYYTPNHDKHLQLTLYIFAAYGFYKWFFYLIFGWDGDFISNRIFGDGIVNPAQFQTLSVAGVRVSRFVSATGEASMYVFSVLPFCIYFTYYRAYALTMILLLSLALTLSGSFVIGLAIWGVCHLFLTKQRIRAAVVIVIILLIAFIIIPDDIIEYFIKEAVADKINQENHSGIERTENFINHIQYFWSLPFLVKIFGLGFGVVRSTDWFSTLFVNTGVVGFVTFTFLFIYPIVKLTASDLGLRVALIVTYIIMMVSVAEYAYPSLWLLIGMAYQRLQSNHRQD